MRARLSACQCVHATCPVLNIPHSRFVDGNFHGKGTFAWADGSKYVGEFMDDMFHGRGQKLAADGTVEHDGLFWCDEPQTEDD